MKAGRAHVAIAFTRDDTNAWVEMYSISPLMYCVSHYQCLWTPLNRDDTQAIATVPILCWQKVVFTSQIGTVSFVRWRGRNSNVCYFYMLFIYSLVCRSKPVYFYEEEQKHTIMSHWLSHKKICQQQIQWKTLKHNSQHSTYWALLQALYR